MSFGAGVEDCWVLKLDPNGDIEWQKTYGGPGPSFARSVQQTTDGGFVVAGITQSYGAGDYDCWMYILLKGSVNIVKDDKIIRKLQRNGDIFGEMGIIDGSPRSASIVAAKECLVLGIDGSIIDRCLNDNNVVFCYTIYRIFSEVLAARLRDTTTENTKLRDENHWLRSRT